MSDKEIRVIMEAVQKLRVHDDGRSTYLKLELIKELTQQVKEYFRMIK